MKKLAIILVYMAMAIATPAVAQDAALKLGNEGSYPPFSITKPDGTLTGIDVEIAREICRRIGRECEFQTMEFKALLPSLITGKIDMIAGGLSRRPERLDASEFLDPHVLVQDGWLLPAGWGKGITDEDLNGLRIGIIKGAAWIEFMKLQRPSVEIVQYDNLQEIFLDMSAGRIDGAYGPELGLSQVLEGQENADKWTFVPFTFEGRSTAGNSFAVGKGKTALRDQMNAALKTMFEDCTYTKIRSQFTKVKLSSREPDSCIK